MKKIKLIFQIILMFFLTYSYIYLLPNQVKSIKNNNYLTQVFTPKRNNMNEYVSLISRYNNLVYEKDYYKHYKLSDDNSSIELYLFRVASVNLDQNVNAYYVYVKEAIYKGHHYNELSLKTTYKDNINDELNETVQITMNSSPLNGFYITELIHNGKKAEIQELNFGIMVSRNILDINFLNVSKNGNDKSLFSIKEELSFNEGLNEKIINDQNIPTENEKDLYNIDYVEFNPKIINEYFKHGWLIYFFYSIIVLIVVYFIYVKDLITIYKKRYEQSV